MNVQIRIMHSGEAALLANVAPGAFDAAINPRWAAEFLADRRHHLAAALEGDLIVGMASAVDYLHPDKAPQLWINEIGVAPNHRNQGTAKLLLGALLTKAKELQCTEAWVLTEQSNEPAMRLYGALGGHKNPERQVMFEFNLSGEHQTRSAPPLRRQYHLRPSDSGLLAWDVARLIDLAQDFPRIQLPLAAIRELDEPFWFGQDGLPTCRSIGEHAALIEAADLAFPIILSSDGRVMDGMHRATKAAMLGWRTVSAVQFPVDPTPDHIGLSPEDLPY